MARNLVLTTQAPIEGRVDFRHAPRSERLRNIVALAAAS